MLNIEEYKFYLPKVVLCFFIWIYLITESAYVAVTAQDTIDRSGDKVNFAMRCVGISLLASYMVYFALISVSLTKIMNMMKKAYKHLICVTLVVIAVSLVILCLNGQVNSSFERPILYVA
jgi:ABC-type sugar transport system permease subunit